MGDYKQADRPLMLSSPLGPDVLFLRRFAGREAISQLFWFELDLFAESKTEIPFDKVLGEHFTIRLKLPKGERQFDGICARFTQGERDPNDSTFTSYRAEIVPQAWLLTHKTQSKVWSPSPGELTVPEILKKVLASIDVSWKIKEEGKFKPRNFCVQYRETDFNFASRLMEEEGLFYFFKHEDKKHTMVVSNDPDAHPSVPGESTITFEELRGGYRDDDRIKDWEKVQELRAGKYTLWDHSFELPHKNLEAQKTIQATVMAGKVSHKLTAGNNSKLELYDWPGEYAQRFDGVDKGGGDRPANVQNIFQDNTRTVEIRMQAEAVPALLIRGGSNCRQLTSGHKFTLTKHHNGDGPYVLTAVRHRASGSGDYRAGRTGMFRYENEFECIPAGLPFRPQQVSPRPIVHGTQSAVVVGPAGEEIFTDKYGRVKVQFHWDREGKHNQDSSCWIRVATSWAGRQWGVIHIPRIGQEVVVDFLEGDPDQPIIIGSVYNADMMPPYKLPGDKTQSGVKSRSTMGGDPETFNEFCFEDKKGQELVYLRAEKDLTIAVENGEAHWVGQDREKTIDHDETTTVHHDRTETVDNNETITIHANRSETVDKDEKITISGSRTESVGGDESVTVSGSRSVVVSKGDDTHEIKMGNQSLTVTMGKSETSALQSIELTCGKSSIKIDPMGITLKGMTISVEADLTANVKGVFTTVEAQAFLTAKGLMTQVQSQAITQVSGLMTEVSADALLTASGGLTMIG